MENRESAEPPEEISKLKKFIIDAAVIGGFALFIAALLGVSRKAYLESELKYSCLPKTNIVARAGDNIEGLARKYVDIDEFPSKIIEEDFYRNNTNFHGKNLKPHASYIFRYDTEYLARKTRWG